MAKIYLALDWKCISPEKIALDELGGTERRMMTLLKHLQAAGHTVVASPNPGNIEYDIAIYSNSYQPGVLSRKKVAWIGSWHADPNEAPYDKVVFVSEFMRSKYNWPDAEVVSASYNDNILEYKSPHYIRRRIVCTSNPNRWIQHGISIAQKLRKNHVNFHFLFCGGNRLYSDHFPECFQQENLPKGMTYLGVLPRDNMLRLLASAHMWVYPNLSDESETFCVAAIEPISLGIPVIVPDKEPFREVLGNNAFFAKNEDDFVDLICKIFFSGYRVQQDITKYSEQTVMSKFITLLENML